MEDGCNYSVIILFFGHLGSEKVEGSSQVEGQCTSFFLGGNILDNKTHYLLVHRNWVVVPPTCNPKPIFGDLANS